jgi:hypothetical protein
MAESFLSNLEPIPILDFERSVRCNTAPSGADQDEVFIQEAEGDVRNPANKHLFAPLWTIL